MSGRLNHLEAHRLFAATSRLKQGRVRAMWQRALEQLGCTCPALEPTREDMRALGNDLRSIEYVGSVLAGAKRRNHLESLEAELRARPFNFNFSKSLPERVRVVLSVPANSTGSVRLSISAVPFSTTPASSDVSQETPCTSAAPVFASVRLQLAGTRGCVLPARPRSNINWRDADRAADLQLWDFQSHAIIEEATRQQNLKLMKFLKP